MLFSEAQTASRIFTTAEGKSAVMVSCPSDVVVSLCDSNEA
ncbi:MAG: hypothetical protein WBC55_05775 [Dehalococcoidia bacterium]